MNQAIDFYPHKQQYLCESMKRKKTDCLWKKKKTIKSWKMTMRENNIFSYVQFLSKREILYITDLKYIKPYNGKICNLKII